MSKSSRFPNVIKPNFTPVAGSLPYVEPATPQILAKTVKKTAMLTPRKSAKGKATLRPSKKAAAKKNLKAVKGKNKVAKGKSSKKQK